MSANIEEMHVLLPEKLRVIDCTSFKLFCKEDAIMLTLAKLAAYDNLWLGVCSDGLISAWRVSRGFQSGGTGIFHISKLVRKGSNGSFLVPGFNICTLWLSLSFYHYWARSLSFYDTFDSAIIGLMVSPSCSMCWIHRRCFLGRFLTTSKLSCHAKRMDTSQHQIKIHSI